jgi:hypothetical protein
VKLKLFLWLGLSLATSISSIRAENITVLVSDVSSARNYDPIDNSGYVVRPVSHADINIIWNASTKIFTGGFRIDNGPNLPAEKFGSEDAIAYLPSTAKRQQINYTEQYEFRGALNDNYWILPSSPTTSNTYGVLYLGLTSYDVPKDGTFKDDRLVWTIHSVENLTTPSANAFYGYAVTSGSVGMHLTTDPTYPGVQMDALTEGHDHRNLIFKATGMYRVTFRIRGTLAVTDTEVSSLVPIYFGVETAQIPTQTPATGYDTWKLAKFSPQQANDSTVSGLDKDPDGDGAHNLLEYSLGGDPNVADHFHRPEIRSETFEGKEYLAIRFRSRVGDTSLTVLAESTSDLLSASWVEAVQVGSATPDGTDYEEVTYRATIAKADAAKQFMRVRVLKE